MKEPSRFFHSTTMTKYTAASAAAEIKYKQTADDHKPKLGCKHDRTPL